MACKCTGCAAEAQQRAVEAAVAAERAECAHVADYVGNSLNGGSTARAIAEAIRARSGK